MTYNYRDKLRRTLMDMHIENWNPEFMSQFDPEAYFESLKIAKINAPMIYIQSHVGLCYWPTKSGEMHSGLIGKEDAMKRLFDLCHDDGMAVVAYYSIIYNNWPIMSIRNGRCVIWKEEVPGQLVNAMACAVPTIWNTGISFARKWPNSATILILRVFSWI